MGAPSDEGLRIAPLPNPLKEEAAPISSFAKGARYG